MPQNRPISELKHHFNHIANICLHSNEPIYLTRRGRSEFVLMSLAGYEKLLAKVKTTEETEADVETLWVREAEQRYSEIELGEMTCRPLEEAVNDIRGKLT